MRRILFLAACAALAGCGSGPEREREYLQPRRVEPGREIMPGLTCVSVTYGSPHRVVVRNDRGDFRHLVWYARFRTIEGYEVKSGFAVRELIVPAGSEATIEIRRPRPEADRFELLVGDRP
ncbi:MAG: hypothetical protein HYY18_06800 [Planctomycetes bacterium]|nr:hypothetical protein [Planctomycetota bacterium]